MGKDQDWLWEKSSLLWINFVDYFFGGFGKKVVWRIWERRIESRRRRG